MNRERSYVRGGQTALAASALTVALLASTSGTAMAQAVPVEIEGPISSIECLDGAFSPPNCEDSTLDPGVLMTVMGIAIEVRDTATISSPTRNLNLRQLSRPARLPGRRDRGFEGGTAIVIGESGGLGVIAADVFVEPAENVVLGEITANDPPAVPVENEPSGIELQGSLPIVFIADNRMAFEHVTNVCGFEVDPASLTPGTPAGVEGYFGQRDDNFYAFLMEAEGGTLVDPGLQVSLTRARCDETGRLEVRGCGTAGLDVRITAPGEGVVARADLEVGDAGDLEYRARVDVADLPSGVCPARVVARLTDNGVTATARADVAITP
jgi:hypothetical protein